MLLVFNFDPPISGAAEIYYPLAYSLNIELYYKVCTDGINVPYYQDNIKYLVMCI